jgi:hypothetical protein
LHIAENAVRTIIERSNRELRVSVEEVARLAVGGLNGIVLSFLVHRDDDRARRDIENLAHALIAVAVGPVSVT